MILKIGDSKFARYNNLDVTLRHDSVASDFSFSLYFDPNNAEHKKVFKPGQYQNCTVEYNGKKLITGTLLSPVFTSEPEKKLVNVSGYSKTGILEDCNIPHSLYPLQGDNLNLKEITEKILSKFNLKLVVDASVSKKVGKNYKNTKGGDTQSIKSYIAELANQKHVLVTHDADGHLVFTEANTKQQPKFHFDGSRPATSMQLQFNGQSMHSDIRVQRQASSSSPNKGKAEIKNPYVLGTYRPKVSRQTSGNDTSTDLVARNMLSEELKALSLRISVEGWEMNGELILPNTIITVQNPELFIYEKAKFFIEQVQFKDDGKAKTAEITAYLPEVYSSETPKNIFG